MKGIISIIFILLINSIGYSQTEICEENSVMYSICYQLDTNGTFKYDYSHCTGSELGFGTYSISKESIEFKFDTLQSPQIKTNNKERNNDTVTISHFHVTSGYAMVWARVDYKGETYRTDSLGKVTLNYSGGPIIIYQYFDTDSLTINPDSDKMDTYFIYWHSPGDTFMNKGKEIKMVKVGSKYKLKQEALKYDDKKDKYYPYKRTTYYIEKNKNGTQQWLKCMPSQPNR